MRRVPKRFDLSAELADGLRDRRHAWGFIRGFAETWQAPLRDEDGYSDAELNAAEAHLGFTLPVALREAYMLFGKRADLCGTMNFLQPPDGLYVDEEAGLLMYHAENQGVWERYIRLADLDREDPPTLHSCEEGHEEHGGGVPWIERLSAAFVEMVLYESLFTDDGFGWPGRPPEKGTPGRLTLYGELLEQEIPEVGRRFAASGLPFLPVEGPECPTWKARWFTGQDVIVCIEPFTRSDEHELRRESWDRPWSRACLQIRGRTPEAIDAVEDSLPKEWFQWEWHEPGTPYRQKP
jgi:hypothetical protein